MSDITPCTVNTRLKHVDMKLQNPCSRCKQTFVVTKANYVLWKVRSPSLTHVKRWSLADFQLYFMSTAEPFQHCQQTYRKYSVFKTIQYKLMFTAV